MIYIPPWFLQSVSENVPYIKNGELQTIASIPRKVCPILSMLHDIIVPFHISSCSTLTRHVLSHPCRPTLACPPSPNPLAVLPELTTVVRDAPEAGGACCGCSW